MSYGNRHFGKYSSNGEEVVILGYRKKTNEVLIVFLSALQQQEAQDLRSIVSAEYAQKKDYLMDNVGGNVLEKAHHPSGNDWQSYLMRQAVARRGGMVRSVSLKDVEFFDEGQKAFFGGYGVSIEPEIEALRQSRVQAQEAALSGRTVLPEPTQEEIQAAMMRQKAADAAAMEATKSPESAAVEDPNAALIAALGAIVQGQQAIVEKLDAALAPVSAAPAKKPRATRKTTKKPATRKTAKKATTNKPKPQAEAVTKEAAVEEVPVTEPLATVE